MSEHIEIIEHSTLSRGEETKGTTLSETDFAQLKEFIFSTAEKNQDYYLQITSKNGKELIKAKNYVGSILLPSGTTIDILPKIESAGVDSKKLLIEMLSTLKDSPYITSRFANLDTEHLPLFELFIRMFVDEIDRLQKYGLRSKYVAREENLSSFKGKLLITEQIRHNFAHAERFYVQYDDYNINRPINRLIKASLELLQRKSTDWKNKKDIARLLDVLDEVESSRNYEIDIAKVDLDRNMTEFHQVFAWCKVFLRKKSFTSFSGDTAAMALLFDMNKLFESYVAARLRKYIPNLKTQVRKKSLFDAPECFELRPDLLIEGENPIILDTKWKVLDENQNNYGISQSDMYQMYVYQKRFRAKEIVLLYPKPDWDVSKKDIMYTANESEKVIVKVRFVDLGWGAEQDDKKLKPGSWKAFAEEILVGE